MFFILCPADNVNAKIAEVKSPLSLRCVCPFIVCPFKEDEHLAFLVTAPPVFSDLLLHHRNPCTQFLSVHEEVMGIIQGSGSGYYS